MTETNQIESLINKGHFLEARLMAEKELLVSHDSLRIQQLRALAMSKSGSSGKAISILEPIYLSDPDNTENSGILAGIYKQMFRLNKDQAYGIKAYKTYLANFIKTKNYYTGINAASMSIMIGRASEGRKIAQSLIKFLENNCSDFWQKATLAEAYLLDKQRSKATEWFLNVRKEAKYDWGIVNTIRNQLWLLNHFIMVPGDILNLFKPPVIGAFSGHMIDLPGREVPRFTHEMVGPVYNAIKGAIKTLDISVGYSSLASGADILFAEALIEEGRDVNVVLPFKREDFIAISVKGAGEEWVQRFEKIEAKVEIQYLTHKEYRSEDVFFKYLGEVLYGSAILHARQLGTIPKLLTVLSSYDLSSAIGGTRDMLSHWPYQETIQNINIDHFRNEISPSKIEGHYTPNINLIPISGRTISNILSIKFKFTPNQECDVQIREFIDGVKEDLSDTRICIGSDQAHVVITSSSTLLLLEAAANILNEFKFDLNITLAVVLHSGPILFSLDGNCEHDSKIVIELQKSAVDSTIIATKAFVAKINLETDKFKFEHAGFINVEGGIQMEIFGLSS